MIWEPRGYDLQELFMRELKSDSRKFEKHIFKNHQRIFGEILTRTNFSEIARKVY